MRGVTIILSEPLYHSTFTYVSQSLDLYQREVDLQNYDDTAPATKQNLLDIFGKRDLVEFLKSYCNGIINFLDFVTRFCIVKGNIRLRPNPSKVVVITTPSVRYNPSNREIHQKYCFYQLIKYGNWKFENLLELNNMENSVERWESFLLHASPAIMNTIK